MSSTTSFVTLPPLRRGANSPGSLAREYQLVKMMFRLEAGWLPMK